METVGVESSKSYHFGFILTESEIRRLIDVITDQFTKINSQDQVVLRLNTTFKNGAIAETNSLDEILTQENTGSSEITRLKIEASLENDELNGISVEFVNVDAEEQTNSVSIRQQVHGVSRDWVFVTSSLIEERITKLKRFALNQLGKTPLTKVIMSLLVPGIMMLILLFATNSVTDDMTTGTNKVEELWKKGQLKDPVEAIIMLEKCRNNLTPLGILKKPVTVLILVSLPLILTYMFLLKYYLVYVFCWGDYKELFEKKESIRKFVLGAVVIGLIVSVVGGLIANNMGMLSLSFLRVK